MENQGVASNTVVLLFLALLIGFGLMAVADEVQVVEVLEDIPLPEPIIPQPPAPIAIPPIVSIVSPLESQTLDGNVLVILSIESAEPISSAGFSVLDESSQVVSDQNADASMNYSGVWDSGAFPNGSYALNAVACNSAGCGIASTRFFIEHAIVPGDTNAPADGNRFRDENQSIPIAPPPAVPTITILASNEPAIVSLSDENGAFVDTGSMVTVPLGTYNASVQFTQSLVQSADFAGLALDQNMVLVLLSAFSPGSKLSASGNPWKSAVLAKSGANYSSASIVFNQPNRTAEWYSCDALDETTGDCPGGWVEESALKPLPFDGSLAAAFSFKPAPPTIRILSPQNNGLFNGLVSIQLGFESDLPLTSAGYAISFKGKAVVDESLDANTLLSKKVSFDWDANGFDDGEYGLTASACHEFSCASESVLFSVSSKALPSHPARGGGNARLPKFDRSLECHKCGQHKAPPEADVNFTVSVSNVDANDSNTFTDYVPIAWNIVDSGGGAMEDWNSEFRRIVWVLDENDFVGGIVQQSYVARSPALFTPPEKYFFFSEFAGLLGDDWFVIVSDPNPTSRLFFRKSTSFDAVEPKPNSGTDGNFQWGTLPAFSGMNDASTTSTDVNTSVVSCTSPCIWPMATFTSPPLIAGQSIAAGAWGLVMKANVSNFFNFTGNLIGNVHVWDYATDTNSVTLERFAADNNNIAAGGAIGVCDADTSYRDVNGTGSAYTTKRGDKLVAQTGVHKAGSSTVRTLTFCWGGDGVTNTYLSFLDAPTSLQFAGDINTGLRYPSNNSLVKSVGSVFDVNAQANCLAAGGYNCGKATLTLQYCKLLDGACSNGVFYDMNAGSGDLVLYGGGSIGTGLNDTNQTSGNTLLAPGDTFLSGNWKVVGTTDGNYTLRVQADGNLTFDVNHSGKTGTDANIVIGGHAKFAVNNPGIDENSYNTNTNFPVNGIVSCADGNCNQVSTSLQYCIKGALSDSNKFFDYNLTASASSDLHREVAADASSGANFSVTARDLPAAEINDAGYANISTDNGTPYTTNATSASNVEVGHRFKLDVNQAFTDIYNITLQFNGYGGSTASNDKTVTFEAWREGLRSWVSGDGRSHTGTGAAVADYNFSYDINRDLADINNFFDFDKNIAFRWRVAHAASDDTTLSADYVNARVKALNLDCGPWYDVNSSSGAIQLVSGSNPDVNTAVLKNEIDDVNWVVKATVAGYYELRLSSTLTNGDSNTSVSAASEAIRTIQAVQGPVDLSFAVAYPAVGCTVGKGSLDPGVTCDICYFDASTGTGSDNNFADRNQVSCEGQTVSGSSPMPFFSFDNQSTLSTPENWFIDLNQNLPASLKLKVSQVSSGYQAQCTGYPQPTAGCQDVNADSNATIKLSIPFSAGAVDANAWFWADFVSALAGTVDRNAVSGVSAG